MSEPMPLSSFKRFGTHIATLPTGMALALLVHSSALARQTASVAVPTCIAGRGELPAARSGTPRSTTGC